LNRVSCWTKDRRSQGRPLAAPVEVAILSLEAVSDAYTGIEAGHRAPVARPVFSRLVAACQQGMAWDKAVNAVKSGAGLWCSGIRYIHNQSSKSIDKSQLPFFENSYSSRKVSVL